MGAGRGSRSVFPEPEREAAVALWGNTTLGLMLHWWQANKQQAGRGNIGKQALANFVTLDPRLLSEDQLQASATLMEEVGQVALRPFNEIDLDEARAELDRRFLGEVLLLPQAMFDPGGAMTLLRAKLSREPSIAGAKRRPEA